jgi:hypothetical protein
MRGYVRLLLYGSFWDVPRFFVIRDAERDLIFSSPFREDLDEYDAEYIVFTRSPIDEGRLKDGWRWEDLIDEAVPVARVPVASVVFDASKRAAVKANLLDLLRERAADPALAPLITSIDQLRRYDDPVYGERPPAFDEGRERARVQALLARVKSVFETRCASEIGAPLIQDASHFATIEVPGQATDGGEKLLVRVSNFSPLLAVASAALESPQSAADRNRLVALAVESGYRAAFAGLLRTAYDGENQALKERWAEHPEHLDWWTRFFDWL